MDVFWLTLVILVVLIVIASFLLYEDLKSLSNFKEFFEDMSDDVSRLDGEVSEIKRRLDGVNR